MAEHQLPIQFVGLEPFLGWALATEHERTTRRQVVGMAAIRIFTPRCCRDSTKF
jgi:hypothetical protein